MVIAISLAACAALLTYDLGLLAGKEATCSYFLNKVDHKQIDPSTLKDTPCEIRTAPIGQFKLKV
jgi:hypothetical protein